jgi:o-succinylbenzoate synthase
VPQLRLAPPARDRSAALKLDRIEVRHLRLPLRHPFETSFGRTTDKRFLLVSVAAEGVTGHGECVADADPYYLPETLGTAVHVLRDFLAPAAFAADLREPRDLLQALARVRGHEMAKASLEMAVWDLFARRAGVPLYRLLGGRGGTIPAGVSIGLQRNASELVDTVAREVEAGYRRVKIKIKPGQDLSLVAAVRDRFPSVPLMADANSAYTLADAALFRELDAYALMMVEQPLAWDDMVDHAELQRQIRTPVCLDESVRSREDARKALDLGACQIVNIKAGRVGGFAASVAIQALCRARGADAWCGGMLESGIGRLANVHLQTLPGFTLPGDTSASARYFTEDLVEPPVTVAPDGTIAVPEGPGIGHEVVWPRVEKATLAREEWRRT